MPAVPLDELVMVRHPLMAAVQIALAEAGFRARPDYDPPSRADSALVIPSALADRKGDPCAVYFGLYGTKVSMHKPTLLLGATFDLAEPDSIERIVATTRFYKTC